MNAKFKKITKILDATVTLAAAVLSVGATLYGVGRLDLKETWPELVLNVFYIACLAMIGARFIKKIEARRFAFWSAACLGATVVLRDIVFFPPLSIYPMRIACLALSALLLVLLAGKRDMRLVFGVDMTIAILYNIAIYIEPFNEYTKYLLIEIWIRPTLFYALSSCCAEKNA